jgi:hypothetical protein
MAPVGEADIRLDAEHQLIDLPVVAALDAADEPVGAQAVEEAVGIVQAGIDVVEIVQPRPAIRPLKSFSKSPSP